MCIFFFFLLKSGLTNRIFVEQNTIMKRKIKNFLLTAMCLFFVFSSKIVLVKSKVINIEMKGLFWVALDSIKIKH